MKIAYSSDVDILYIRFNESKIEESDEEKPGIIFDYDKDGNVVGLEIQDASKKMVLPVTIDYALAG